MNNELFEVLKKQVFESTEIVDFEWHFILDRKKKPEQVTMKTAQGFVAIYCGEAAFLEYKKMADTKTFAQIGLKIIFKG